MLKIDHKKGQAASELAVFGAILIFLLGTIVRSAMGNSYTQDQNFKTMRMAMLASWKGTEAGNLSHNSASIIFIEDRLSPDFNKYGDVDRNPFIAQGAGTFTYNLLYPLDASEVSANLPIMDIYINGQHFPFTTASYVQNRTIVQTSCGAGQSVSPSVAQSQCLQNCQPTDQQCVQNCKLASQAQCQLNQCLRNYREWVGGVAKENQFETVIPITLDAAGNQAAKTNASTIFNELATAGLIEKNFDGTDLIQNGTGLESSVTSLVTSAGFISSYASSFPGLNQTELNQIQSILQSDSNKYKLFYTLAANGTGQFSPTPLTCSSHPCKDQELSSDLVVRGGTPDPYMNTNGDAQYDLLRLGNYVNPADPTAVESQFPPIPGTSCLDTNSAASLRCSIAWQWIATAGTSAAMIGLDPTNNQYPQYDIDGRLKEVTIYGITQNPDGTPTVTYEDMQGGDIDTTWDSNSCTFKPGLQSDAQIFSFTKAGTYLQIKEGKLFNPETDQYVRSANQKDNIDLIQRKIQLSNNTGRFCNGASHLNTVANDGVTPNPVEVCIAAGSSDNCFSNENNIKSTCFDGNDNMLFVRSRLEDRRGHFWMTDTSGQLKVQ